MDDILIFAETKEELERIIKMVLAKLWEHDLFLKAKKCEFDKWKIEYLGMVIEEGWISMDPIKLVGIWNWLIPSMVKQVRLFLGFGNFYQKFIFHYSDIARPLNNLTKKDKKFEWTEECQMSFDTLKQHFTEEPVLLMPDHSKPFQIESDASKVATGAVLTQTEINTWWLSYLRLLPTLNADMKYTTKNYSSTQGMETLHSRIRTHNCSLIWSQKLDILQNCPEIKRLTSPMVTISLKVWHQIDTRPWNKDDTIQCLVTTTRPWNRWIDWKRRPDITSKWLVCKPIGC